MGGVLTHFLKSLTAMPAPVAVLTLVVHLATAWFFAERAQSQRELRIAERLAEAGVAVETCGVLDVPWDGQDPYTETTPWRVALGSLLGHRVQYVSVSAESKLDSLTEVGDLKSLRTLFISHDLGPNLGFLWLQRMMRPAPLRDLTSLKRLEKLEHLIIQDTPVQNLPALARLESLRKLTITNTATVNDISPLAGLRNLRELQLSGTSVDDISALGALEHLRILRLENSRVKDLKPLSKIRQLQELYLDDTLVDDVRPLATLTNLEWLDLSGTNVKDVAPLAKLPRLKVLVLHGVRVDLAPLSAMEQLEHLSIIRSEYTDAELASLQRALPRCRIGY